MIILFKYKNTLEHKKTTVKEIAHREEAVEIIQKCLAMYEEKFGGVR